MVVSWVERELKVRGSSDGDRTAVNGKDWIGEFQAGRAV